MDILTALRLQQQQQAALAPPVIAAPVTPQPYLVQTFGSSAMSNTPAGQRILAGPQTVADRLASGELSYDQLAPAIRGSFQQYAPVTPSVTTALENASAYQTPPVKFQQATSSAPPPVKFQQAQTSPAASGSAYAGGGGGVVGALAGRLGRAARLG